ncbi:sugar transferase [Bacteroidetes/Chlorobi group bacterium ChocPot_Mid]|nr:MAG: sugar transferase [Bacteroidetes/Chlorobi group bacterium ChocPot_Mid]
MNNVVNSIRTRFSPQMMQLMADILSVIISFSLQYYIRFHSSWYGNPIRFVPEVFFLALLLFLVYWIAFFWFSGLYKNWYVRSPFDEFFTILRVTFFGSFFIFFVWLLDSESKEPRMLFLLYFVIFSFIVILGRYSARIIQRFLRAKGIIIIPAIIVGTYVKSRELYQKIIRSKNWGYQTLGVVLTESGTDVKEGTDCGNTFKDDSLPVIGKKEDLIDALDKYKPREVLISEDSPDHKFLLNLVSNCADRKIIVKIIPDLYSFFTGQAKTLHLYGIPLIEIDTVLLKPWQDVAKRIFDIVFSLIVLVIGLPIWLLTALIVKLESKGNVFYLQERTGKNGKNFNIIKFRSMVQDAEKSGPQWAKVNDPRVTRFGRFMRSSHLDEVPQFINVLKGDMSIVGPRPERPVFVEKFSELVPYYKRRLLVRPGITGWWQVKYTTYVETIEEIENRLKDDFFYIENMSFKLDLEIIVRTIFLMFKGHGQT